MPIFKKGEKPDVSNNIDLYKYTVSLLISNISKIFQKVIHNRLLTYLDRNYSWNPSQHGFRSGKLFIVVNNSGGSRVDWRGLATGRVSPPPGRWEFRVSPKIKKRLENLVFNQICSKITPSKTFNLMKIIGKFKHF